MKKSARLSLLSVSFPFWLVGVSKVDHTLVMINPQDFSIAAKMPVGADPHEVVTSPDGKFAYVSNTGSGKFHEINVIDLENKKALESIDTGALLGPHGLQFIGDELWFTAEGAKAFGRYNPKDKKIDLIVGIGQNRNHMIDVAPDLSKVLVSNVDSGTISLFENLLLPPPIPPIGKPLPTAKPAYQWIQTSFESGKGAEGFAVTPDRKQVWVANAHETFLTTIDLEKKKVSGKIETKTLGLSRVAFTPEGKRALISSLRTGELLILDVGSQKLLKTLDLGVGAAHILIEPSGTRAFISCTPDHKVVVVDLEKLEIASTFKIGDRPDGLAWAKAR